MNNFLQKNDSSFLQIANNAPVMIWISDITKDCIWFNQPWLDFTGRTQEQEYGNGWADGVHPDDLQKCLAIYTSHFDKKEKFKMEYRLKNANGEYRWLLDNGAPFFEDGVFKGYIGSCIDITDQIDSEVKVKQILETVYDGFWDWHIKEDYEYMSPRFWEMLGVNPKTKNHHPSEWQKLMHPEDLDKTLKLFGEHVASRGLVPFDLESRFTHQEGHQVWILCRGKIIEWSKSGEPLRMVGTHTDITELKNTQILLYQSSKLAELGEISAGIAHEINNPLTVIMNRAQSLLKNFDQNSFDQERVAKGLEQIHSTSIRISKIINGLKSLSRDANNDPMSIFNLLSVVEESILLCHDKLSHAEVNLIRKFDQEHEVFMSGRSTQILQVLVNLLSNAVDAIENLKEKWIELKIQKTESAIVITVTDCGLGISNNVLFKIFNPFFSTKESGKGTGLGLSLSKKMIEDHKGELYYDQNSKHTCFVVKLPIQNKN